MILAAKTKDFKNIVIYQNDLGLDANGFYVTEFTINGDRILSNTAQSIVDRAGVAYRFMEDYAALLERYNVDMSSITEVTELASLSSLLHLAPSTPFAPFECAACHKISAPGQGTTSIPTWAASPLQCTLAASKAGFFPQP